MIVPPPLDNLPRPLVRKSKPWVYFVQIDLLTNEFSLFVDAERNLFFKFHLAQGS